MIFGYILLNNTFKTLFFRIKKRGIQIFNFRLLYFEIWNYLIFMKSKTTKRKICILSGKRGGFGSLIRTMKLIQKSNDLELQLVVTDMHLSQKFGKTLAEVKKNFPVAAQVDMEQKDGTSEARSEALGVCLQKMTSVFKRLRPDIFLCLGDRGEVVSAVIAANNLHIPVAHIQGGDISGNLDEVFRHAITKMSHIHFPSTQESGERIKKMGEEEWRIHVVGDTHLDLIGNKMYTSNLEVRKKFHLTPEEEYVIVLQHPVNTEPQKSYVQMKRVLRAVKKLGVAAIVVYPCSDQGYEGIIQAIEEQKHNKKFRIHKNVEAEDFLGLMSGARALVGNSSSGIIEAPLFKLPTINIGKRQTGRQRDANIIDIGGETEAEVYEALLFAFSDKKFRKNLQSCGKIYGDGKSAERIVKVLKTVKLNDRLFEKRMTY